jgi:HEAT repeat protein
MIADPNGDRDVRRQAVYALSQLPRDTAIPLLIDVARKNRDPDVRRAAFNALGRSNDPRAIALFEEVLLKK